VRFGILTVGLCLSVGLYSIFDVAKFIGVALTVLALVLIEYRLERMKP
jgi:hypothetical protein